MLDPLISHLHDYNKYCKLRDVAKAEVEAREGAKAAKNFFFAYTGEDGEQIIPPPPPPPLERLVLALNKLQLIDGKVAPIEAMRAIAE